MKTIRKTLMMPADEIGSYAAIKIVALDLVCATIGSAMRPDLKDRVSSIWQSFLSPEQPDKIVEEVVTWFRGEAGLLNELGGNDLASNMTLDDISIDGLPWIARC